jgi:hypothetical protein
MKGNQEKDGNDPSKLVLISFAPPSRCCLFARASFTIVWMILFFLLLIFLFFLLSFLLNRDQLDPKNQRSICPDNFPRAPLTISKIRRNKELPFRSFFHELQCLGPTRDQAGNLKSGRLPAFIRAVKFSTVDPPFIYPVRNNALLEFLTGFTLANLTDCYIQRLD